MKKKAIAVIGLILLIITGSIYFFQMDPPLFGRKVGGLRRSIPLQLVLALRIKGQQRGRHQHRGAGEHPQSPTPRVQRHFRPFDHLNSLLLAHCRKRDAVTAS